ncbi:MAG TPA: DNA-directed RNA polymerase subunit alpha [Candidatus Cloacimonas sp.]|mgnify:FL=1|jgi:DNA-directed RNA polymerase subunit alpha|nr:DNA-directed RNA polymerase subunit alpha [Candidatus Cloacimonas sp.]MDD2250121.1 DNA-directed RNA polymerase subunit alpha [Candidatus Cloacimonadota bacterium]MCK9164803.1 DNA-directed RNA polymerase subunit alpha [Candidatus Cloacimonas sp.]MDD3733953.1 DNA-directed RNA polymerase subunit alpha [Candidatus Cloacimonadota bacterium]MDD3870174.1 DNA-directed RNA polymerase subunit alpha [Candidatus Cloacimonadota bacterium]
MMYLEPLQMPETVDYDKETYSRTFGKFEIGPLEPGFGTTLGNTLRRILLSSIQGAAVRFVRIEGLHHEFCPIPGTNSDYIDLILRIKQLVIQSSSIEEVPIVLEHKGKGVITASMIQETPSVKIINKDLYLLEVMEDVDFRLEMIVGIGRGYVSADRQNTEGKAEGFIPIDSIYSPVLKVNFSVSHQRVKERMNFDRLIMEIFSNGAIEPSIALFLAAKILKDMAAKISLFETEPQYIRDVELDPDLEEKERILQTSVREIELSVRAANCLAQANIETIGDLVSKSEAEMLKFRNFGKKSLEEIVQKLKKYELHLGMDVEGIYRQIREARSRGVLPPEEKEIPIPEAKPKAKPKTKTAAEKVNTVEKKTSETATATPPHKPVPSPKKKVKNET